MIDKPEHQAGFEPDTEYVSSSPTGCTHMSIIIFLFKLISMT